MVCDAASLYLPSPIFKTAASTAESRFNFSAHCLAISFCCASAALASAVPGVEVLAHPQSKRTADTQHKTEYRGNIYNIRPNLDK